MTVPIWIYHIVGVLCCTMGEFINSETLNGMCDLPEDEFLPREKRKLSFLFIFFDKKKPIRWRAYWRHRIAEFNFLIYVVIMVVGRCISGSFDFLTSSVFAFYPFYILLCGVILEIGTIIYVKIKRNKRNNDL